MSAAVFNQGDRVRLKSVPDIVGTVDIPLTSWGEVTVEWDIPNHMLDTHRLPGELEIEPGPSPHKGERIWVPATILRDEADSDGDWMFEVDALSDGGTCYINNDQMHRVLRPEVVS